MNWKKLVFYSLLALLLGLAVYFYRFIFSYLGAAILVSYLMDPLVEWFERRHIPRWASIIIVYVLILATLAFTSIRLIPVLSVQAEGILAQFNGDLSPETLMDFSVLKEITLILNRLDSSIPNLNSAELFANAIGKGLLVVKDLPNLVINNISAIIGTISFIATVPILSFFVIKDKYLFRRTMLQAVPNRYFELALVLMHKIDETVGRFFRAILFEIVMVWIMASIAFTIAGVPNSILIAAIAGFANVIPYFGPFSGWAVAALTILITGKPTILIIWAALAMYIVQVIDNNIVYPVVVGKTISMHPLIVLLTVITAGWIGGILWMLISVPLVYIVYSLVKVLYDNLKAFKII